MSVRATSVLVVCVAILSACSHPITISPPQDSADKRPTNKVAKTVAYVIRDKDRSLKISHGPALGDPVTFQPYNDLDHGIKDTLESIYDKAILVSSVSDERIVAYNVHYVFIPEIFTSSASDRFLSWVPTTFTVKLDTDVMSQDGGMLARIKVTGNGSDRPFQSGWNPGIAGQRASADALEKFGKEILLEKRLH